MDTWLEETVGAITWQAIEDKIGELAAQGEAAAETKLKALAVGEKLSASPLVAVVAKAPDASHLDLLVRGRFKLFDGALAPFVRLQIRISTDLDTTLGDWPVRILEWQSVVGDLQFEKKDVFQAEIGFGWDDGTWLGRGALKIKPAKFALDILLGGLDERGLMLGVQGNLPAPVPLGATGLVLTGIGGDFAYNFVPRLNGGVPKQDGSGWDARDYVAWSRDRELDAWEPGPPERTAVGVRLAAVLGDLSTMGWTMQLGPIGLAVLTPGPVFVLGGKGRLVNTDAIAVEGYVAVDVASESLALGLTLDASVPKDGDVKLLQASGSVDGFFSFRDTSLWYLRVGTKDSPAKVKVLSGLNADAFLMIGHGALPPLTAGAAARDGIFFGVGISYGGSWEWWVITFTARVGARAAAGIGWNPFELEGAFGIYGELGLKLWKFWFRLLLQADVIGHLPRPTQLTTEARYVLDLPWPIPDVEGSTQVSLGEDPSAPDLKSPLLSGSTAN